MTARCRLLATYANAFTPNSELTLECLSSLENHLAKLNHFRRSPTGRVGHLDLCLSTNVLHHAKAVRKLWFEIVGCVGVIIWRR